MSCRRWDYGGASAGRAPLEKVSVPKTVAGQLLPRAGGLYGPLRHVESEKRSIFIACSSTILGLRGNTLRSI